MSSRTWIASSLLILTVLGAGGALAGWKLASIKESNAAAANQPEPIESVTTAVAEAREHRGMTTAIGTVLALRSITLRNELAGTVDRVALPPGAIVEAGTVLVELDVSVEEAELAALEAQATLAETQLARNQVARESRAVSETEVDRARAERDVALARIARTQAIIARKTIRAPFRARIGLSDVHPGQYLDDGTELTTLQGVDRQAKVDFAVAQQIAAGLRQGDSVAVIADGERTLEGMIVAIDAQVDPTTRNALVRARIADTGDGPAPGASVRVEIPVGPPQTVVVVPVSALRKGPEGDHVYVIAEDQDGKARARQRKVESGPLLGDVVVIVAGLDAGERVAASGSFKLHDSILVAIADSPEATDDATANDI